MKYKHKTVFVNAFFGNAYREKVVHIPTGETKKLLGVLSYDETVKSSAKVATGPSDSVVDGKRLAYDMQLAIVGLEEDGYEVVSVMPVTSGCHHHEVREVKGKGFTATPVAGWGYGYGFSYTEGVIITARKEQA